MDNCLKLLLNHLSFLYKESGYRVIDSRHSNSFGNGFLILEGPALRIMIVSDRGQLCLDFSGQTQSNWCAWQDCDAVFQLLDDEFRSTTASNKMLGSKIQSHLQMIEQCFSPAELAETLTKLSELKRERADNIFGAMPGN